MAGELWTASMNGYISTCLSRFLSISGIMSIPEMSFTYISAGHLIRCRSLGADQDGIYTVGQRHKGVVEAIGRSSAMMQSPDHRILIHGVIGRRNIISHNPVGFVK